MAESKTALITGITGQDGSYLAELLLQKGYRVWGTLQRSESPDTQLHRLEKIVDKLYLRDADVLDMSSLLQVVHEAKPDEIYHLAAQSDAEISFRQPTYTLEVITKGTIHLLEIARQFFPHSKVFHPASAEMFGNLSDPDGYQRETTPMHPVSPYGCAKLAAYSLVRNYRNAYGLPCWNGIEFNHESPRRGTRFVTNKIVKGAVGIAKGLSKRLELGNLESFRDWGYAPDFAEALWMILQNSSPDDFVIATGETHTVREACEYVFTKLGLDYQKHITLNEQLLRPEELQYLRGDASKLRSTTGWKPKHDFYSLLDEMIAYWDQKIKPKHTVFISPPADQTKNPSWFPLLSFPQPVKPLPSSALQVVIAEGEPLSLENVDAPLQDQINSYAQRRREVGEQENQEKLRVSQVAYHQGSLYLALNRISYKQFLATSDRAVNDKEFREELLDAGRRKNADPNYYFANPLAISILPFGYADPADKDSLYVVLGKRSPEVLHCPEWVHAFGSLVPTSADITDLVPVTAAIAKHKLGLKPEDFATPLFYDCIRQQESRIPELIFGLPLNISPEELESRWLTASGKWEHSSLLFSPQEKVASLLSESELHVVPSGEAAVHYLLQQ